MRIMNTNVTIAPGTPVVTAGAAVQISDMSGAVDLGTLPDKFMQHAVAEGLAETPVPGVKMFRVDSQTPRAPALSTDSRMARRSTSVDWQGTQTRTTGLGRIKLFS